LMTGGSLGGVTSGTMLGSSGYSMATTPSTMSQPSLASGSETVCPPGMINTGLGCSSPARTRAPAPVSR
jgi:hypothetical protein